MSLRKLLVICSVLLICPTIIFGEQPVWFETMNIPFGSRRVGSGAWLVTATYQNQTFIFCAKGTMTTEFYDYNVQNYYWGPCRSIPLGFDSTPVGGGAKGAYDENGFIYMTKGGNTFEFWRYNISSDSWQRLPDVPIGVNQRITEGSDLIFGEQGDSSAVYLLKGVNGEFYRYMTNNQHWEVLPRPPSGSSPWADGSFLVYDGTNTIYAHKAGVHEHFRFNINTLSWDSTRLDGMPFVGHSGEFRPSGSGGSAAWYDGSYYALKGSRTPEFWRYDPVQNNWFELDSIPLFGSTGRIKRVGPGGDIVVVPNGSFYAMKGDTCLEFWRYGEFVTVEENINSRTFEPRNPTVIRGVINIPSTTGSLFNITGQKVMNLEPGINNISYLAPGVYFIKDSAKNNTNKIVIQR